MAPEYSIGNGLGMELMLIDSATVSILSSDAFSLFRVLFPFQNAYAPLGR